MVEAKLTLIVFSTIPQFVLIPSKLNMHELINIYAFKESSSVSAKYMNVNTLRR